MAKQKPLSSIFKKRLRELRRQKNWTQEKAAEMCGVPYKVYQLYELGIKENPGLKTLEKICDGFGVTLHELFREQKEPDR